jgi:guanylate kinase
MAEKVERPFKMIAIIGQAGSGKDTILRAVCEKNHELNEIISCTTRPMRDGEIDGINYHFYTVDKFTEEVLNDKMLEASCFNNWFYGTSSESLLKDKVNIGVYNPEGIESLMLHKDIELYVFLIEASDKVRLIRQLNREKNPDIEEIFRRYKTDRADFADLPFHHNVLENECIEDLGHAVDVISHAAQKLQAKLGQF